MFVVVVVGGRGRCGGSGRGRFGVRVLLLRIYLKFLGCCVGSGFLVC